MTVRYDAFISYDSNDKAVVERLCVELKLVGVQPWFDDWELAPGDVWMRAVEGVLDVIPVVLVCVGAHGFGPWHDAERQAALQGAISKGSSTVVPVLLPTAPAEVELPVFLRGRKCLDLRDESGWTAAIARLKVQTITPRSQPEPADDERDPWDRNESLRIARDPTVRALLEKLFGLTFSKRSRREKLVSLRRRDFMDATTSKWTPFKLILHAPDYLRHVLAVLPRASALSDGRLSISIPSGGRVTIGRHEKCNVRLDVGGISSLHAIFEDHHILDCASKNGTFVNGLQVARCGLHGNDIVTFGDVSFLFYEGWYDTDQSTGDVVLAIDIYHPPDEVARPRAELDLVRRFVVREVTSSVTGRSIGVSPLGGESAIVWFDTKPQCLLAFEKIAKACQARTKGILPLEVCGGIADGEYAIGRAIISLNDARLRSSASCIVAED